ncbi:M20/M25/M40 family metallo-hydrolase [Streptomyces rhizosphaericus]|uniref:M20/M25/M40 family metallo-hydrolase n=1 Tax=Streptomyces rhizosphaericus TaxID=114699 RepID=UPI001FC8F1BE|nr:M20/M25/M40 family metallo-hydrolase [Streptomyces rhizosphaericus]
MTALAFPVAGLLALTAGGHLLLPFDGVTTLEGKIASKSEFFEDEKVQRILMKHGIRVHITRMGSRDIATTGFDGYDFAFPSGQPAADMIKNDRKSKNAYAKGHSAFVSPIVLATYREYAETLRDNGLARPRQGIGADENSPLYYTLNMKRFIGLSAGGKKWSDIGIEKHRTTNGNRILAQTSNICEANHAGTTRIEDRRDPMLTYANTVLAARKKAKLAGALATFGKVSVEPNGVNAIASLVRGWLDSRAADEETLAAVVGEIERAAVERGQRDGVDVRVTRESFTPVVEFAHDLRDQLSGLLGGVPILPTGAGHDAGILSASVPTAMLFVRNPTGVSHSPAETAGEDDCLAGVAALAEVLEGLACH